MGQGGAPWIFAINGNDLPISFTFVDHAQNTQHFDRPHFALHCVYHCICQHERTGNTLIADQCKYQHQRTCIVYINMRERAWDRAWVQAQTTHRYTHTHIYLHHTYTIHHTYIYTRTITRTQVHIHPHYYTIRTYTPAHRCKIQFLQTSKHINIYAPYGHIHPHTCTHLNIYTHTHKKIIRCPLFQLLGIPKRAMYVGR